MFFKFGRSQFCVSMAVRGKQVLLLNNGRFLQVDVVVILAVLRFANFQQIKIKMFHL